MLGNKHHNMTFTQLLPELLTANMLMAILTLALLSLMFSLQMLIENIS